MSQLPDPQSLTELADTFERLQRRRPPILRTAIEGRQPVVGGKGLGSRIHEHFARIGGVDLELPERSSRPIPAEFQSNASASSGLQGESASVAT